MELDRSDSARRLVIGMIHLPPLPGTPFAEPVDIPALVARAVRSAKALEDGGASGCLVQTADRVYAPAPDADPARVAAVALVVDAVRRNTGPGFEVGVHVMWNAIKASLAVARVAGAGFVRASMLVGATMTIHGIASADPYDAMQYRRSIDAVGVRVVADIHTMHFKWLTPDRGVGAVARTARAAGADAVSVCDPDEDRTLAMVAEIRDAAPGLPVILGGHTHHGNAARLLSAADGAFVGTCLERGGWGGEIDAERVRAYVDAVVGARS